MMHKKKPELKIEANDIPVLKQSQDRRKKK